MSDCKLAAIAVYVIALHVFALNGVLAWFAYMGW